MNALTHSPPAAAPDLRTIAVLCSRLCVGLAVLGSACSSSYDSRNDSEKVLRLVPVPVNDATAPSLGPLKLEPGQVLKHQTYTISRQGEFTLNRLIESDVGSIGASLAALSPTAAERLDMEPYSGVLVRSVRSGGPAVRAGIQARDAILSFGGQPVDSRDQLVHLIETTPPGTEVPVEFNHKGELSSTTVEVVSETRAESVRALHLQLRVLDDRARSGVRIAELPRDIHTIVRGSEADAPGLMIIDMLPGGPAFFSELRVRDLITRVDGFPAATHEEYDFALKKYRARENVRFEARRQGRVVEATVALDEDATAKSGFNLLNLVKYKKRPEEREFSMVWELLFHSQKHYAVEHRSNEARHTSSTDWGAFLNLLHYRSSPTRTQLDLLWILPITFRSEKS